MKTLSINMINMGKSNMKIKNHCSFMIMLFLACLIFQLNSARGAASVAHGADACLRQLNEGIDGLQGHLPAITKSAEQAAAAYVRDGYAIAAFGEPGLVSEAVFRAGGLIAITSGDLKSTAKTKTIVLLFPHPFTLQKDFAAAKEIQKQGGMIILFGTQSVADAAIKAGMVADSLIDTGFPRSAAKPVSEVENIWFPADSIMNIAALWCWTGEFVSACTRLGKMPPLHQSYSVPGAKERAEKIMGLRFHPQTPPPVAAAVVGSQYLAELKKCLAMLNDKELVHIRAVAEQAAAAVRSGHAAYVVSMGHALDEHLSKLKNTGQMLSLKQAGSPLRKGDFVFAIAYDDVFPQLMEDAQRAEAGLAWSLTDYKTTPHTGAGAIPQGQIFINQRWSLGDGVITIPEYETRILPSSGFISETILWMVLSEIDLLEASKVSHKLNTK
jgi:uncharacterized phosphosugar-binding protein